MSNENSLSRRAMLGSLAILPFAATLSAKEKEVGKVKHLGSGTLSSSGECVCDGDWQCGVIDVPPILRYNIGNHKYEILTYEIKDGELIAQTYIKYHTPSKSTHYCKLVNGVEIYHREDGPAVYYSGGKKTWWKNGEFLGIDHEGVPTKQIASIIGFF